MDGDEVKVLSAAIVTIVTALCVTIINALCIMRGHYEVVIPSVIIIVGGRQAAVLLARYKAAIDQVAGDSESHGTSTPSEEQSDALTKFIYVLARPF